MKYLKLLLGVVGITAFLALGACTHEEPENPESEQNDAYWADQATIGSDSDSFIATDDGGEVYFQNTGGTVTISVDCVTGWIAENTATDLFTVTVTANSLTISAQQNHVEKDLTGTIILSTANQYINFATITVTQDSYDAPTISVDTELWNVPAVGELSAEFSVDASDDWTAGCDADWLTAVAGEGSVTLTAQANSSSEERSAKVELACTDGFRTATAYISVTQDAVAQIALSETDVTILGIGGSKTVGVESNYDWTCSYDTDNGWLTVTADGDCVTLTAEENESEDSRELTVAFTAGDGLANVAETQLTVTQSGATKPIILTYTISDSGTTITLPIAGKDLNCIVDWGDGDKQAVTDSMPTHSYVSSGEYDVSINGSVKTITHKDLVSSSNKNTVLTAVKQWGTTGLTSMRYAFYYCSGLKTIPTDSDGSFSDVTTFFCAFSDCNALEGLPDGLLSHCSKVTDFGHAFYNCVNITSLTGKEFAVCTEATSFTWTFANCSNLEAIPVDLFANCTKAEDFSYTFYANYGLESIPAGIFSNNTEATTFENVFGFCCEVRSIEGAVFSGASKATSFADAFDTCEELTTIPEDLFKGCSGATSFNSAFASCSALTTIPEGLFADCPNVTNFGKVFQSCSSLKSIPTGLFDNNLKVTNFNQAFGACKAVTGYSPYTDITVDGETVRVHLYERLDHTDHFPISKLSGTKCFNNCKSLTDYYDIPSDWGGGGD